MLTLILLSPLPYMLSYELNVENTSILSQFDSNKAFGHSAISSLVVTPVSNIIDGDTYDKLEGVKSTDVVTIDGSVYALILSGEGLSVINITIPGSPRHVDSVDTFYGIQDSTDTFDITSSLSSIASVQIDDNMYAILSNSLGFVVLNISNPANGFLNVDNIVYYDHVGANLSDGKFITVKIDGIDYFILSIYDASAVYNTRIRNITYSVNNNDVYSANFYMDNITNIDWGGDIATTKIGNSYILATSIINHQLIIVNLDDLIESMKNNVDGFGSMIDPTIISDDDPGYATLKNATDVTAITIDGSTYALVTAYADNGVQIIDISDPSSPKPVSSVIDGSEFTTLQNPVGITTVTMDNFHYALVASEGDDGVQIIDITNPSLPIAAYAIIDDNDGMYPTLKGAKDVITDNICICHSDCH